MSYPSLVSIVIINFNGKDYLRNCLKSILKNDYPHYEIIIVDNGSWDGTIDMVKEEFGELNNIKVVELDKNYGPAKARNIGVKNSNGEIIGFLDNDTEVDPAWTTAAIKYFKVDEKIGILQCKLLLLGKKNKIDYVGEYMSSLGFLVHRARYGEKDNGRYDKEEEILAAKSAGMFIKREVFDKIGGFDEDYFIFVEETDLGWRTWMAGYKVIFASNSRVFHHYSATKVIVDKNFNNHLVRFHGTKNYILTLYKNLSFKNLIIILPKHIFLWLCLIAYLFLFGRFRSGWNILKGILWNIKNYPISRKKRKRIQITRVISDKKLFEKVYKKRGLPYYIKSFFNSQKQISTPEN